MPSRFCKIRATTTKTSQVWPLPGGILVVEVTLLNHEHIVICTYTHIYSKAFQHISLPLSLYDNFTPRSNISSYFKMKESHTELYPNEQAKLV